MQIQAAMLGRVPAVIIRSIVGWALMLSSGAVLIDGGWTRNGIAPNADWRVITFGLALLTAGGLLVRHQAK